MTMKSTMLWVVIAYSLVKDTDNLEDTEDSVIA
jgi:hypothetical protein